MQDKELYTSKQIKSMIDFAFMKPITLTSVNRWLQDFKPAQTYGKTKFYDSETVMNVLTDHDIIKFDNEQNASLTISELLDQATKWQELEQDSDLLMREINKQANDEDDYITKRESLKKDIELKALIFGIAQKLDVQIDQSKLDNDVSDVLNGYKTTLDPRNYVVK